MDRLELIREQTDAVIQKLVKEEERKFAYIHTYGVAQAAAMLATLRKLDVELCCIAAMLHDIALYAQNCPHLGHAQRSAEYAKLLLPFTKLPVQYVGGCCGTTPAFIRALHDSIR